MTEHSLIITSIMVLPSCLAMQCSLHLTTVSCHCSLFMGWNVTCDLEMDLSDKFLILFWGAEIFGKCNPFSIVFLKQRVCNPRLLVPLITISSKDPYPKVEYGS